MVVTAAAGFHGNRQPGQVTLRCYIRSPAGEGPFVPHDETWPFLLDLVSTSRGSLRSL